MNEVYANFSPPNSPGNKIKDLQEERLDQLAPYYTATVARTAATVDAQQAVLFESDA